MKSRPGTVKADLATPTCWSTASNAVRICAASLHPSPHQQCAPNSRAIAGHQCAPVEQPATSLTDSNGQRGGAAHVPDQDLDAEVTGVEDAQPKACEGGDGKRAESQRHAGNEGRSPT